MLHIPPVAWWIAAPFFAWRVAVRLRRLLSRQRYVRWRHVLAAVSLAALTSGVAFLVAEERVSVLALASGLIIGALLGKLGIRLTRFERDDGELYFQPNRYLGSALTLLLLGRIVWRLVEGPPAASAWTVDAFVRNPSTMLFFGLFSAHYIVFAAGIVRRASAP